MFQTQYTFELFENLIKIQGLDINKCIFIIDENVFEKHEEKFRAFYKIILPSGENFKNIDTIKQIYEELVNLEADRNNFIIGVGGGVCTDVAGFVASTYMRGLKFGFVPTSLLAMVDASIGGKNGVDLGVYKNLVGTINQAEFIFYDINFLDTLPHAEWVSGCAEIIKHACIKDQHLFNILYLNNLEKLKTEKTYLLDIISKNVDIKKNVIENDPFEKDERKILNFGHTLGHAIENTYQLSHGFAISIGMVVATHLSHHFFNLNKIDCHKIISIFEKYNLPVQYDYELDRVFNILKLDKKKDGEHINFILLKNIGYAEIKKIAFTELYEILKKQKQ